MARIADIVHMVLKDLPMDCKVLIGRFLEKPKYVKACSGGSYVAFLRNDGQAVIEWAVDAPWPSELRWSVPELPTGVTYVNLCVSFDHMVLLQSDGQAVMVGAGLRHDMVWRPNLPNVSYVGGAASYDHCGVLLRDDGRADFYDAETCCRLPNLPRGVRYVSAASDADEPVLLRSDGKVLFCGRAGAGAHVAVLPDLPSGVQYTSMSIGRNFMLFLRSDGGVETVGSRGQRLDRLCSDLPHGFRYEAIAAGWTHVALLRNDGEIDTAGMYERRHPLFPWLSWVEPVDMPSLPTGLTYVSVDAMGPMTVAVRSDGEVIFDGKLNYRPPPSLRGLRLLKH